MRIPRVAGLALSVSPRFGKSLATKAPSRPAVVLSNVLQEPLGVRLGFIGAHLVIAIALGEQ